MIEFIPAFKIDGLGFRAWPVPYCKPLGTILELGELCFPSSTNDLNEDIVSFKLEDETWIDVGFYPPGSLTGYYMVVHFGNRIGNGSFEDGEVLCVTQDILEVSRIVSMFGR